jgi:hypothetical protein
MRRRPGDSGNGPARGPGGPGDDGGRDTGDPSATPQPQCNDPIISPVTPDQMPVLCDRFHPSDARVEKSVVKGLINVNTASPRVLRTIVGLSDEDVEAIVSQREMLSGEDKASLGWLVAYGALEPQKFAVVAPMLTTRSIQFTAEVIGFADHSGAFKRIQAILEMRGHIAQVLYYRDITSLGIGYPVRDDERSDGLAFVDF